MVQITLPFVLPKWNIGYCDREKEKRTEHKKLCAKVGKKGKKKNASIKK